ncbi:MAG: acyltransferase [Steroidobacteraceae bacterium]|jgi:acetyltransferase-like isoleucine patch superfamily enzyme
MNRNEFKSLLLEVIQNQDNPFHPLVWINGTPDIGADVYIGGFSEINAKGAQVRIGAGCDIASFVAINVADSHLQCIGLADANICRDILIGDHVFIGSHCAILGGSVIGHHSVIGAGTVVRGISIPPFSLVIGTEVKAGFYRLPYEQRHGAQPE